MTNGSGKASDPGTERIEGQRDERARQILARSGRSVRLALDLGCGRGDSLGALGLHGVGVDLGILRLRLAPVPVAQADGARLPFPDGVFDLVVAMDVFSAVPAEGHRRVMAAEAVRVLAPDGVVLWYDRRWANPASRSTGAVSRRALDELFPRATIEVEPITVIPELARAFPRRYDVLHRLSPLRSHLIGTIRPRS